MKILLRLLEAMERLQEDNMHFIRRAGAIKKQTSEVRKGHLC